MTWTKDKEPREPCGLRGYHEPYLGTIWALVRVCPDLRGLVQDAEVGERCSHLLLGKVVLVFAGGANLADDRDFNQGLVVGGGNEHLLLAVVVAADVTRYAGDQLAGLIDLGDE